MKDNEAWACMKTVCIVVDDMSCVAFRAICAILAKMAPPSRYATKLFVLLSCASVLTIVSHSRHGEILRICVCHVVIVGMLRPEVISLLLLFAIIALPQAFREEMEMRHFACTTFVALDIF